MKWIPLVNSTLVVAVDDDSYEELNNFKWYVYRRGEKVYACTGARVVNGEITPLVSIREIAKQRRKKVNQFFDSQKVYDSTSPRMGILMHRMVIDSEKGMEVDHINGDGLDNRRSNLRVCTREENGRNRKLAKNNTTGYHGVSYCSTEKRRKRYQAAIRIGGGRRLQLGRFYTAQEAAVAYNIAAKKYHGRFATLNNVQKVDITTPTN